MRTWTFLPDSNGLAGLAVGAPIVIVSHQGDVRRRVIAKVARIWVTDDLGYKFRIADGEGEGDFGGRAYTTEDYATVDETRQLGDLLVSWGWVLPRDRRLTLDQLRRAASLLMQFEAEVQP